MKKFASQEEVLEYLKSLDDFGVISRLKVSENYVCAENENQRSIMNLLDRRLTDRFEVTGHVEQIVKERCATQHVSNALKDYLDIREILEFATYERKIHIKFKDEHVLLVEVFYFEDKLALEVAAKYRLEDDHTCERISLSTKDRIEMKDLFDTIEKFDRRADRLLEASNCQ